MHLKNQESLKKQAPLPGSLIFHHFMFVIDVAMCQVPSEVATHSRLLIQNKKNYLLFKDHLNDDFPKVGVLHNVTKNADSSLQASCPTYVLHSASHTMYVSGTKSEDMGFA